MPRFSWQVKVERRVSRWARSGLGPGWVVAVSGGSDSVGLLRIVHELADRAGLTLSVAHLNHNARGDDSRADAAFVENLARTLGLPCDLGQWTATRPGHFEADARRARYAWLAQVARARGANVVAVGQTRDDQAETVLHRILRGTGIHGLAGIPNRRPLGLDDNLTLLRPLLNVSRVEIRAFLDRLKQPFREDASNADLARTRARLRHDLLPKLANDYNPAVADALVRLARLAAGASRQNLRALHSIEKAHAWRRGGSEIVFPRDELLHLPRDLHADLIRLAWRSSGWPEAAMGASRWSRLAQLARRDQPGRFDIGAGVVAETGPLCFALRRSADAPGLPEPAAPLRRLLDIPGAVDWPGGRVVATLNVEDFADERMDLDRLIPPVFVRAPIAGDRFNPLGMGNREQPLNDFFRGRHVAPDDRARTPLVCDAIGIVWVVGHRISDRVRLQDSTVRELRLRWEARTG